MKRAFLTVIASATVMLSMAQIALEDLHTATFEMKEPERFNIVDDATHVWDRVFAIREDTLKDCWRFYTTGGAKVSSLLWYSMEPHFNEGVCAVKLVKESLSQEMMSEALDRVIGGTLAKAYGCWCILHRDGTFKPMPKSVQFMTNFRNGLAMASDDTNPMFRKWYYVDTQGKRVFPNLHPEQTTRNPYDWYMEPLLNDRRIYKTKDKYGYINGQGKVVIQPKYIGVRPFFCYSYAIVVTESGDEQIIDHDGRTVAVVPPNYKGYLSDFSGNGLAFAKNDSTGRYDLVKVDHQLNTLVAIGSYDYTSGFHLYNSALNTFDAGYDTQNDESETKLMDYALVKNKKDPAVMTLDGRTVKYTYTRTDRNQAEETLTAGVPSIHQIATYEDSNSQWGLGPKVYFYSTYYAALEQDNTTDNWQRSGMTKIESTGSQQKATFNSVQGVNNRWNADLINWVAFGPEGWGKAVIFRKDSQTGKRTRHYFFCHHWDYMPGSMNTQCNWTELIIKPKK